MERLIKLYGERNTNTNYMSRLIGLNLDARELRGTVPKWMRYLFGTERQRDLYFEFTYGNNLGWKHSCVKPPDALLKYRLVREKRVAFVSITKNPYSWLLSLHRNHYHQEYREPPSFEEFLTLPWKTVGREECGAVVANPVELWNLKNASYLHLRELGGLNITTESLFEDAEAVIAKIGKHFGIGRRQEAFVNYEVSTKNRDVGPEYYRDYYLNERWAEKLSNESLEIINRTLDRRLVSYFGYELRETASPQ